MTKADTHSAAPAGGYHLQRLSVEDAREIVRLITLRAQWQVAEATLRIDGAAILLRPDDADPVARAADAVVAIDRLITLFPDVKDAMVNKWAARPKKKAGRRRPDENYWLSGEIADILAEVPGVDIRYSKTAPTTFMQVLELCFSCLGMPGSVERYAIDVAKLKQPTVIEDATWADFLNATSKRPRGET